MQIDLYSITDDPRKLEKTLDTADTRTGAVRGAIDVLRPEVLVEGGVVLANYAHIPDFGRYYFIEEREAVRKGLQRLQLRVDVLMSYKDQIKTCPAVFDRSQNLDDAYLSDGSLPVHSFQRLATIPFFREFTFGDKFDEQYVVILAG